MTDDRKLDDLYREMAAAERLGVEREFDDEETRRRAMSALADIELAELAEAWVNERHQGLGGPGFTYLTDGDRARLREAFQAGFRAAKKGAGE